MANVKETIDVIVEDLNKKINDLNNIDKDVDSEALAKINDIKQKAITVLKQVSSKIVDTVEYIEDDQEVQKSIEIVKNKSQQLYDNAINKINEIVKQENVEEYKNEIEDVFDTARTNISEFLNSEVVSSKIEDAKRVGASVADRAINTLNNWLKTEEK